MKTRGKFQCLSDKKVYWNENFHVYEFNAVSNDGTPENDRFHKYTPAGTINISVDNPNVVFTPGQYYYVDFTSVND